MTLHGGDVWHLGVPVEEVLDFSANVNPRGLPPRALARLASDAANPQLLQRYPDTTAHTLRSALSRQLDVPPEAIVIGPGAEALLAPALRSMKVARALVPVPAFSEYRKVCETQNIEFVPFPLESAQGFRLCAKDLPECDALILNNPHNPTGTLLEADEVRQIAARGTPLLLDEAFIDYAPHASLTKDAVERKSLIVLRSLTKFYGCPALRVGYAVAHPDTAREIAGLLPTWPVSQSAMDALSLAIEDREYADATRCANATQREILRDRLQALGLTVFPSAANYLLIQLQSEMPPAPELRMRLIERHRILIRNCDSYEGLAVGSYIRVAVRSAAENVRLTEALATELTL
jgi:threonine-phosphate decarboxylase